MLSLGGERRPPPLPPKQKTNKQTKSFWSLPAPRSGYATTIMVFFFAHLLILEYPDHHQNLISSSLYYPGPLHKISSQSVHNFLSNVVHRQTDRQTNRQTNATKNITSFAKEVTIMFYVYWDDGNLSSLGQVLETVFILASNDPSEVFTQWKAVSSRPNIM